jgi:hypothetical protein
MLEASDGKEEPTPLWRILHIGRTDVRSKATATDEGAVMKTQKQGEPVVRPPDTHTHTDWSRKTERALEIRESTAKARADKPIAFPTRRARS